MVRVCAVRAQCVCSACAVRVQCVRSACAVRVQCVCSACAVHSVTGLASTVPHAVTPSPESARPGSAWQDAKSRAHMHSRERRVTRGSLPSEATVGPGGSVSGHAHASRQPHKLKIVSTPQKGL